MSRTEAIVQARRIVVKIGSALLTDAGLGLSHDRINAIAADIDKLKAMCKDLVVVSSGAVAEGCNRLGWRQRPETVHELQAAAAVGQMGLVEAWEQALRQFGCGTAIIMLTHDDVADRERYLNARATMTQLLNLGIVPVINENDTVATEEIRFGDNDTLAALVANLIEGDLLVVLTDVAGVLSADPSEDPEARLIEYGTAGDPSLERRAGAGGGALGRGGMISKLRAAELAARSGAHTVIADGKEQAVLSRIVQGEAVGTFLEAQVSPMTARKRWIAGHLRAKGSLVVDSGAAQALTDQGVSLLAVGVTGVQGQFERGDVVRILASDGQQVAQGLCNYASRDVLRLMGKKSEEFADHIASVGEPELVHRDNLAIL